jgi:hypothetical protein
VKQEVDTWQRLLAVRSLVVRPTQDLDTWLRCELRISANVGGWSYAFSFASLERKNDQLRLAIRTVHELMRGSDPPHPSVLAAALPLPEWRLTCVQVTYAAIKLQWHSGQRQEAISSLADLINSLSSSPCLISFLILRETFESDYLLPLLT